MEHQREQSPAGRDEQPPARRPYAKPRVRSSEVFERAAAGCATQFQDFPCNSTS